MYLIHHLRKFHQIYNLGAAGDKDELLTFCGQKIQGHSEVKQALWEAVSHPSLECMDTFQ